jgi:hypothetical protein
MGGCRKALVLFLLTLGAAGAVCAEPNPVVDPALQAPELSDQEVAEIRDRVLQRCGLSSKLSENKLPWYFHYEFGVELINRGAAEWAVEPLQMTANLKSEPRRSTRMYGMWFVNYLPYYQISLAWSELHEWDRAWDAIRMSEEMLEFSPGDFEYEKFASLKELIEQNRRTTG